MQRKKTIFYDFYNDTRLEELDMSQIEDIFDKECRLAKQESDRIPIIPIYKYDNRVCLGYSPRKREFFLILGYKTYLSDFDVYNCDGERIDCKDVYIHLLSDETVLDLCLNVFQDDFNIHLPTDPWVVAPPKELDNSVLKTLDEDSINIYRVAVQLITESRKKNLGHAEKFCQLERSVFRMEKLAGNHFPSCLLVNEIKLMRKRVFAINEVMEKSDCNIVSIDRKEV